MTWLVSFILSFPCLGCVDTVWVSSTTKEGDTFYFNTESLDGSWDEPEEFIPDTNQLDKEEIQVQRNIYYCIIIILN